MSNKVAVVVGTRRPSDVIGLRRVLDNLMMLGYEIRTPCSIGTCDIVINQSARIKYDNSFSYRPYPGFNGNDKDTEECEGLVLNCESHYKTLSPKTKWEIDTLISEYHDEFRCTRVPRGSTVWKILVSNCYALLGSTLSSKPDLLISVAEPKVTSDGVVADVEGISGFLVRAAYGLGIDHYNINSEDQYDSLINKLIIELAEK